MGTEYPIDALTRGRLIQAMQSKADNDAGFIAPADKTGYKHLVDYSIHPAIVDEYTNSGLRQKLRLNTSQAVQISVLSSRVTDSSELRNRLVNTLKDQRSGTTIDLEEGLFFEVVDFE